MLSSDSSGDIICLVSATAGDDYENTTLVLIFPAGSIDSDTQCLNITINTDTLVEGEETFTVTLTLLTTGLGVFTENDLTTVTIMDDEGILVANNAKEMS